MRKAIKQLGVLCLAVMFVFLSGCDKDSPQPEDLPNGTLTIGSDIYSPYFYLDDNGDYAGIDVEIATEACRRLGMKIEFKQIVWQNKDALLAEGAIDCLWGCFTMNGREDEYTWAGPYMRSRQVVVVYTSSDIYTLGSERETCCSTDCLQA